MMTQIAYIETSIQKPFAWLRNLMLVVLGSVLIALCTPLSIKLPFTPIPIAIAPHICLALGAILGSRRGACAVLAYIFQGIIGLPVFALGASGFLHLLGPSGGYLLGYLAAAYVTGYLIENARTKSDIKTFSSLLVGNGIIYLLGVSQLSLYIGLKSAVVFGVLPFLASDLLKLMLVYKGVKRLRT